MLKSIIKQFFEFLGFKISRKPPPPPSPKTIKTQAVGRFVLEFDQQISLFEQLKSNPDYSSHLGRLASLLTQGLSAHPRMIDVGANVGDTVAIVKNATDMPILCIEGDEDCFRLLQRNLRQFRDVEAINTFLSDKTGEAGFSVEKKGWNTTFATVPGSEAPTKVPFSSLDDLLAARPDRAEYKLLKIDAEGFDPKIIRGAAKFLHDVSPVIHFEYNRESMLKTGEQGFDTFTLLQQLGYRRIFFYEAWGRFVHATSLENEAFIRDAHEYADGFNGAAYYFDLIVFPKELDALAETFLAGERQYRIAHSGPRP